MSTTTMDPPAAQPTGLARTGVPGLDEILKGGLPRNRIYLVHGDPGVGKTTLGMQFLLEGLRVGERSLYITLSETRDEIEEVAQSHGWSMEGLSIHELADAEQYAGEESTLFHPDEIELHEATSTLLDVVERTSPTRVVFDSLSEIRLLAQSPLRYRRQILALKQYFIGRHCTVLLLDDRTSDQGGDAHLQSLAHGVINLEQRAPEYGSDRRRMRVVKLRGVGFRGGYHDFTIRKGGLVVFPRLVASDHDIAEVEGVMEADVPELDALLGGGLDRGTATLVMGPAGTGKSSLATQYAVAAAARGERTAMFIFDERPYTLLARADSMDVDLRGPVERGLISIQQVDPAEFSPGELASLVQEAADRGADFVVIDSLNGYLQAMPEEAFLAIQMHEMLTYLGQRGVTTMLLLAQHGLVGNISQSPVDMSYLADTVVLMRYFEADGAIRKAVSVVKKRSGRHENTIREYLLGPGGVQVGPPLEDFHGVLTGVPTFHGAAAGLLEGRSEPR